MPISENDEERSARIARLRGEIGRVIEREYGLVGKYRELAASFAAVMPDPDQRHAAVLLALATALKQEPREINRAFIGQQEELALLEVSVAELFAELVPASEGDPDPESEEGPGAAAEPPSRQRTAILKHCPKCGEPLSLDRYEDRWKCRACAHEVGPAAAAGSPPDRQQPAVVVAAPEAQQPCSRCGGAMHYHAQDARWLCYTCGHEEGTAEPMPAGSGEQAEEADARRTTRAASFVEPLADMIGSDHRKTAQTGASPQARAAVKSRTCPVCRKKMDWHEHEKLWRCFFCGQKTR